MLFLKEYKEKQLILSTLWRVVGGAVLYLCFFLISALGGDKGSTSRSGRFTPGNNTDSYLIGSLVGPRAGLDVSEKVRIS